MHGVGVGSDTEACRVSLGSDLLVMTGSKGPAVMGPGEFGGGADQMCCPNGGRRQRRKPRCQLRQMDRWPSIFG